MAKTYYKPIRYKASTSTHEPMGTDEYVDPINVPISDITANKVQRMSDGVYVGPFLEHAIYYVSTSSGVDDGAHGTEAAPFQTLMYALNTLLAQRPGQGYSSKVFIALKAGETFIMDNTFYLYGGKIVLTFYGDPQYGDFNGPLVAGTVHPAIMADLQRPVIDVHTAIGTSGGTSGFAMIGDLNAPFAPASPSEVSLLGVWVNLPGGPHVTGQVDFVGVETGGTGSFTMYGAIVNIRDTSSVFGLLGMEASSQCRVYQYACQLRINGAQATSSSALDVLIARKWFFKFYPDFAANHQDGLDLFGGSPGSGQMTLSWSDVPAMQILPGKPNLDTYPVLNDPAVGLTTYFFNLTRDQQQRPLNVTTSRLF